VQLASNAAAAIMMSLITSSFYARLPTAETPFNATKRG